MGWTPQALASATGASTTGVRNPDAVLAARLSPAELPVPPSPSARPPWCGECDQVTRMLDYHGDASRPCPKCEPPRPRKANVAERPRTTFSQLRSIAAEVEPVVLQAITPLVSAPRVTREDVSGSDHCGCTYPAYIPRRGARAMFTVLCAECGAEKHGRVKSWLSGSGWQEWLQER